MDCLYFPGLKDVARKEGDDQKNDENGERPRCEYFLLACLGLCVDVLESGPYAVGVVECRLTFGVGINCISLW